ncbi:hypothetical protein [aff. Roholtiella sp. LEGE 12411]|uniref:hypothetical protein n=1 Tax=aff. Roholtiella sp. LEGE 12411 TaxID=1828822 RepID=UPI00187E680B|nr:hypothetical protein [aff. Roholtiella sp. LEGE 12411]MBE9035026.1 hypothetical protein [aff. Roholtiella sp. LEGE 12411]
MIELDKQEQPIAIISIRQAATQMLDELRDQRSAIAQGARQSRSHLKKIRQSSPQVT